MNKNAMCGQSYRVILSIIPFKCNLFILKIHIGDKVVTKIPPSFNRMYNVDILHFEK